MLYGTNNVQVSLTLSLAEYLRARGFDVFWHAAQTTDPMTGGVAQGTVTFVPDFPAEPTNIVRLRGDNDGPDTIVVPALTLQVPDLPDRQEIMGLGHTDYRWERVMRVDGFAADQFQHVDLGDLLHDWLHDTGQGKDFPIHDHKANPASPPLIGKMQVQAAGVIRREKPEWPDPCRYYVAAEAYMSYVE